MVDVGRQWRQVTGLDGHELGQGAVAGPVGDPEDSLPDRQAGRAIPEFGDDPGDLVARNCGGPIASGAVGPGARPVELARREPCRVHRDDDVILGGMRIRHIS